MTLLLPLVLVVVVAYSASRFVPRLEPKHGVWCSGALLIAGALGAIPVLIHVTVSLIVSLPHIGPRVHDVLHGSGLHVVERVEIGIVTTMTLGYAIVRLAKLFLSRRRLTRHEPGGVLTTPDREVYAFATPGAQPTIVVSQGLHELVTDTELDIVLAHERAHVEGRHDRWLLLGEVCSAVNPLMVGVQSRLRFALERVADERAAEFVADRTLVARTLAKVAVGHSPIGARLAVATLGVHGRVTALLSNSTRTESWMTFTLPPLVVIATSLSLLQWAVVVDDILSVCGL